MRRPAGSVVPAVRARLPVPSVVKLTCPKGVVATYDADDRNRTITIGAGTSDDTIDSVNGVAENEQRALDMLAEKLGIDPLEFRILNALTNGTPTITARAGASGNASTDTVTQPAIAITGWPTNTISGLASATAR